MTGWVAGLTVGALTAASVAVLRGPPPGAVLVRRTRGAAAVGSRRPDGGGVAAWGAAIGAAVRRDRVECAAVRGVTEGWSRELRSGSAVDVALLRAIDDVDQGPVVLRRSRAAVAVGGDVGAALRADARSIRSVVARRALRAVAACWVVAGRQGGRLADALERVADSIRADEQHVAHVRAELAGARASARLLAALPVFALLLASGLGMSPLAVLLGDPVGRLALGAGVALDLVGLWWTARIARSAERSL